MRNVPIGTYSIIEDEKTVPYGLSCSRGKKRVTVIYAETVDAEILNNEQTGSIKVPRKTADMTNVEGIRLFFREFPNTGREIRIEAVTDKVRTCEV